MTLMHVVPTGERLEQHKLADCPCRPRFRQIPRDDNTVEVVTLHRALEPEAN